MLLFRTAAAQSTEARPALQLGVLPNVSARAIITNYQPIRVLLERELARPVEVVTAPDFKTFFDRTQAGTYDLVITAAHFARLAQTDAGYLPIGTYQPNIRGLLVMAKERPVKSIDELRGRTLAMANPQSLVAMRGMHWLRERGLNAGADFQPVKAANEDSLGQMVLRGETVLAMLSSVEYRQVPEAHRNGLEIFATFAEVPSFVWLAHRRTARAEVALLRTRLVTLAATEEGKKFFAATGIQGWREIAEAELAALEPQMAETRRLMGVAR